MRLIDPEFLGLPEATLRVKQWDDLVAEFGLSEDGDIESYTPDGSPSHFGQAFKAVCGEEVHFREGEFSSSNNSLDYEVYRWECEDPFLFCEEFRPSEADPLSLFE